MFAILAPGYFQQLLQSGVDFGYSRNVFAAHYPLDVIAGRIDATYVTARTLDGSDPMYRSSTWDRDKIRDLSTDMQQFLGSVANPVGGGSPYAAACGGSVANTVACVTSGVIPTAAAYTQAAQTYAYYLTYNLPAIGDTTLAPVVPTQAHLLIATRYPYIIDVNKLDEILATTELPSGAALDNGSGWARLNLYAAAGGYGAFRSNVTVTMDASAGGLSAFDVWSNNISGTGGLTLKGTGTLVLAGNNTYTGGTSVHDTSTMALTGSLTGPLSVSSGASFIVGSTGQFIGDVTNSGHVYNYGVLSGNFSGTGAFSSSGLLAGNGTFGSLDLLAGSTIAPGHSVGTIHVTGDLTATGSTYLAQVEGENADRILVDGQATVTGGAVVASLIGHAPVLGKAYPILTANGGVFGTFASVTTDDLPFIRAPLSGPTVAGPNDVSLTLSRNGVPFANVATSPNQVAVATAADAGPAAGGLGLLVTTRSAAGAQQAFDALSGEVHASAQTALRNDSFYVREALLGRMRQASFTGGGATTAALATGGPTTVAYAAEVSSLSPSIASALADTGGERPALAAKAANVATTTFWTQAVGSWGRLGSDGNAVHARGTLAGVFSGVDRSFGPGWLAGIAGGYTNSSINVSERGSSASIDSAHLAGYAVANAGAWNMRAAAASSFSTLGTSRTIVFPGFADTATARYGAAMAQVFGEVSYGATLGKSPPSRSPGSPSCIFTPADSRRAAAAARRSTDRAATQTSVTRRWAAGWPAVLSTRTARC